MLEKEGSRWRMHPLLTRISVIQYMMLSGVNIVPNSSKKSFYFRTMFNLQAFYLYV